MELTLESAFSAEAFLGHASYFLLIISMMMGDMVRLRIIVILSAIVGITYSAVWLHDPVGVFWETSLCLVNVVQLLLIWHRNRLANFTPPERIFVTTRLMGVEPGDARRLLDLGQWITHSPSHAFTRAGEPVGHLRWIAEGHVDILVDGRVVADCTAGNFIGEMAMIGENRASADTVVATPTTVWEVPTSALQQFLAANSEIRQALEAGIARDMKAKIEAANRGPAITAGSAAPAETSR